MQVVIELLGLDYSAMGELCGFLLALISVGVFMGIFFFHVFCAFIDLFCDILYRAYKFCKKRIFPNVRKKKR